MKKKVAKSYISDLPKTYIYFYQKPTKKFDIYIRQYYRVFCNKKWSPLATKLSWSHYTELLSIKDERKLNYYISQIISLNLSRNEHYKIFKKIDSNFNDESKVVFEMFKVIEKYN